MLQLQISSIDLHWRKKEWIKKKKEKKSTIVISDLSDCLAVIVIE